MWSHGAAQGMEQVLCGHEDRHSETAQGVQGSEHFLGHLECPH